MKTRVMNIRGDTFALRGELRDEGQFRFLVMEDWEDGRVVRRVRVPLYGVQVYELRKVLMEWAQSMIGEVEGCKVKP